MKWTVITISRPKTTTDELGNTVDSGERESITVSRCRFSPWTDQQVAIYGTEYTQNTRRYIVPYPFAKGEPIKDFCNVGEYATVDGAEYEITRMLVDYPRWVELDCTALRV